MKRNLLLKLGGIAVTLSLLTGATFAAFTSNAVTLSGVEVTSANPQLQIYDPSAGWQTTANVGTVDKGVLPGWTGPEHTFYIRNTSGDGTGLATVATQLTSGAPDWDALKNVVELQFGETGSSWTSGWKTLADWNAAGINILGATPLADGTQRQMSYQFSMVSGADSSAQGKTLNMAFTLVGTP